MYFSSGPEAAPAARVTPSLLRKSYDLRLRNYVSGLGLSETGAAALAAVTYQTRILSCLRPRRCASVVSTNSLATRHWIFAQSTRSGESQVPTRV